MKFKVLRSIAKSLSDMSSSNRISASFEHILDSHVTGVCIDLLQETPEDKVGESLYLQMQPWLLEQLDTKNIYMCDLDSIKLDVKFDYKKTATNLNKIALFHVASKCTIACGEKIIEGSSYNEIWHTRRNA